MVRPSECRVYARPFVGLAVAAGLVGASCVAPLSSSEELSAATLSAGSGTGLALTVDYLADTGTGGFALEIRELPCPVPAPPVSFSSEPLVASASKDLEDATLGAHPDNPFAPQAGHLFSDHFFTLPAGCYHITASPRDDQGGALTTCADAYAAAEVVDGQTTEVLLISQCEGAARGALDVLGSLNHPPEIVAVIQEAPGKFVFQCEWADICVDLHDPDGDPMEVALLRTDPNPASLDLQVLSSGSGQVCFAYTSDPVGAHTLQVVAYDLLDVNGDGTPDDRVEDFLAANITPASPSHDDLFFPVYVQTQMLCDDGGAARLLDRGLFVHGCAADPADTPHVLPPCPALPAPIGTCCSDATQACSVLTHGVCAGGHTFHPVLSCDPDPCTGAPPEDPPPDDPPPGGDDPPPDDPPPDDPPPGGGDPPPGGGGGGGDPPPPDDPPPDDPPPGGGGGGGDPPPP